MTTSTRQKIVFDCNTFAQALISPNGPAGACITLVQQGKFSLFLSNYVLQEIRELPAKIKPKYGVDDAKVEALIHDLQKYAHFVTNVPSVDIHPIDPDDSHYIDLAVATESELIASRDRHLLALMDETQKLGKEFKERFPTLAIITPEALIERTRIQYQ